jgi:hypothetical protein
MRSSRGFWGGVSSNLLASMRREWQRHEQLYAAYPDLLDQYRPPQTAGWKRIDTAICKLQAAVAARQTAQE